MSTVRSCLLLITDRPPLIQEELDLISALSKLEEFGVKVLPLQGEATLTHYFCLKVCSPFISFGRLVLKLAKSPNRALGNKPLMHLFVFVTVVVVWFGGKESEETEKIGWAIFQDLTAL